MATKSRRSRGSSNSSSPPTAISVFVIPGLPEIHPGDNLPQLIVRAAQKASIGFENGDILVIAQKIVSKSEGRLVRLSTVKPSPEAQSLAGKLSHDPRFVEVVLRESRRIVRSDRVLIVETHHGFVCANAGVDHSNVPDPDTVALLPKNPDASARHFASSLRRLTGKKVGVTISDTFGRPWRLGLVNFAIGAAGVPVLLDLRGTRDRNRKLLTATILAVADELAAAAGLLMAKTSGTPVIVIRGYRYRPRQERASQIIRAADEDLFR